MLMLAKAALVLCTVELEADDTYFAVCQGRREGMEAEVVRIVERTKMGAFCTPYEYGVFEGFPAFVVVCE